MASALTYGTPGFNRKSFAFLSAEGNDANGNLTFVAAGIVGVAILLPSHPNGLQIDAISANAEQANASVGTRVVVLSAAMELATIGKILSALPWQIGAIYNDYTTASRAGCMVPDLTQPTVYSGAGSIPVAAPSNGLTCHYDQLQRVVSTSDGIASAGPVFGGRPGGGVVIPPGYNAAVLCIGLRIFSDAAIGATLIPGGTVHGSVHGGPLAPGQANDASAAVLDAQNAVSLARFLATLSPPSGL